MGFSRDLTILGHYLAGEFDNREQALTEPIWFVHLRLWQRPVQLFADDSITLFAEQANMINLDRPYRQRILRLMPSEFERSLKVQYYMIKNPSAFIGGGCHPNLLQTLTPDALELLPGCILKVTQQEVAPNQYKFVATPEPETCCTFSYQGNTIQVALGFESTATGLNTYDKGIDQLTGKATWGAIIGPYRYTKQEQY